MIGVQGSIAQILPLRLKSLNYRRNTLNLRDGVQAMGRLKSAFLIALVALAAPAAGQQWGRNILMAAEVTVIGDVEHCQTFSVPTGSAWTVRQTVGRAGLLSESANVTIIRSSQDRAQWTQLISSASTDTGGFVENGDVLVVQAMSPLTATAGKNAALRTDAGVIVVSLEQDGVAIGDVLQQTDSLPLADKQLKVICRFQGQQPIINAELHHKIAHGDVISISQRGLNAIEGFGPMVPAVSEWTSGNVTAMRDLSIEASLPQNENLLLDDNLVAPPIQFPASPENSVFRLDQESQSLAAADVLDVPASDDADSQESSAVLSARTISRSDDVVSPESVTNAISFASESSTVAPVAPQEIQIGAVANSQTSAFNPWNIVFIGGLLLAGTFILAGTLKPEPDDNTEFSNATARATDLVIGKTKQKASAGSVPQEVALPAPVLESAAADNSKPATQIVAAERPAKSLVANHEWFSGDLDRPVASSSAASNQQSRAVEAKVAQRIKESNHVSSSMVAESAIPAPEAIVDKTGAVVANTDDRSYAALDDLLYNRLPIELCEAQLPLRIALFGKPAGPRRLRIDAAHSAIPAPHINKTTDKRREQPIQAVVAAPLRTPDLPLTSDAETSGSLDRALHFLQERTES
jgi:hypothetical protein